MTTKPERLNLSFSQDDTTTRVTISLPTQRAKAVGQKALWILTSGSLLWGMMQPPAALPPKLPTAPASAPVSMHTVPPQ